MSEQKPKRRTVFLSLRVRLLIVFFLLFSAVFAGAYYWFYTFATGMAMNRLNEDLNTLLDGAAARIDGDQLVALVKEAKPRADGYTDDPRYWQQATWLNTIRRLDPRSRLYTFIKSDKPNEIIFVTSSGALAEPQSGAKFLEVCTSDPDQCGDLTANLNALNGQRTPPQTLNDIYTDKFGSWISGYVSIRNSNGVVIAALGVDFVADYVYQVQQAIKDKILIAFAITYAALFISVFAISRAFTRPITSLTRTARLIGEGKYEQDLSPLYRGRVRDEIGVLAEVFSFMIDKVYQREQTLKRRVEQLRIEVDEARRQKQVSEIVETDFFQELQAKAKRMRERSATQAFPIVRPTAPSAAEAEPAAEAQPATGEKQAPE